MTAEDFDKAIKTGNYLLIRKKITGVIENIQGLDVEEKIRNTCIIKHKYNFRKKYELNHIRYGAQVVNSKIQYDENKPLPAPNLNVLPNSENRDSSLPALSRPMCAYKK
ncbi:hypothetical protein [Legionella saoudiensis]|uniref:hypothetical protein n=1 Tax=Legionella saoudiensis TaxID=1750561 RepID=UPI00122E9389|nr:hypothetical protein [Legionella saoudiensis]